MLRTTGAASLLWLWVLWRRLPLPRRRRQIVDLFLLGCASNALPFILVVWGQSHVPSGLAGIINSSVAIITVVLGAIFFRDEKLTPHKLAGVLIGIAGVAVTLGPAYLRALDPASLGQLSIFAGGFSYALATVYARHALRGIRPEVAAAAMFTSASAVLVPLALWSDGPPDFAFRAETWAALGFLATLSSAAAYILLYAFLDRAGAGNMNLSTLLNGPVAVALGAILFGELLPLRVYAGFGLIAAGPLLIDGRVVSLSLGAWKAHAALRRTRGDGERQHFSDKQ